MKGIKTVPEFVKAFIEGKLESTDRHGFWSMVNYGGIDTLEFKTDRTNDKTDYREVFDEARGYKRYMKVVVSRTPVQDKPEKIAYRYPNGQILVNANTLQFAVRFAYGNATNNQWRNEGQTDQQRQLIAAGAVPIPFTLFDETGLDPSDFRWIVNPKPETVIIKTGRFIQNSEYPDGYPETRSRHFSGSCIFAIGDQYYLFDVDRAELEHNIFNAFITALKSPAESIADAYDQLMPDDVRTAIAAGMDVKRQGEFFFIYHSDEMPLKIEPSPEEKRILMFKPTKYGFGLTDREHDTYDGEPLPEYKMRELPAEKLEAAAEYNKAAAEYTRVVQKIRGIRPNNGSLGKSASGSHSVEKYVKDPVSGVVYVSGKISQSSREHHDLILEKWYTVSPNTATISWTITGNID